MVRATKHGNKQEYKAVTTAPKRKPKKSISICPHQALTNLAKISHQAPITDHKDQSKIASLAKKDGSTIPIYLFRTHLIYFFY